MAGNFNKTVYSVMKRTPFKRRKKPTDDPHRLAMIHALPCVICVKFDMTQWSRTQAHHCIHGRHSTKKRADEMTIPLCEGHHQGLLDTSKIPLHHAPGKWRENYGLDTDYLEHVNEAIERLS